MPVHSTRGAASAIGFGASLTTASTLPPLPTMPNIGDVYQGGYYAGLIWVGNTRYALVMAPKASGNTQSTWSGSTVGNLTNLSRWDGKTNCSGVTDINAITWVRSLNIGGFNDWYIPAIDELELLYRNFKPTLTANVSGMVVPTIGPTLITNPNGTNTSSFPTGDPYTTSSPAQTSLAIFKAGGAECLDSTTAPIATWSSTFSSIALVYTYFQRHDAGEENLASAGGNSLTIRAVRRVPV